MANLRHAIVALTTGLALIAACCMPAFAQVDPAPPASRAHDDNHALFESLLARDTPRALILASMITGLDGVRDAASNAQSIELRERARGMAADDAFVQWFAASSLADDAAIAQSARNLVRIEPDNGVTWLLMADIAADAGDDAGVTNALARIGAAPRFDEYFGAMTLEWLSAIEAYAGATGTANGPVDGSGYAAAAQPLVRAIAFSAALALPAYKTLLDACRANKQPLEPARRDACAAAGSAIATQAKTLISRSIGMALLRNVGDESYTILRRDFDYLSEATNSLSEAALRDPESARAYVADWHETGSEIAVIERLLTRSGKPLKPPADWQVDRAALATHKG